jgi:lipoprotein-anchoring transpeptidase ErfK/SrfK
MQRRRNALFILSRPIFALILVGALAGTAACDSSNGARPAPPKTVPPPAVAITAAGGDQVNPRTPIVVKVQDGRLSSVDVTTPEGKHVAGARERDGSGWHSTEVLGYESTYEVTAAAVGKDGKTTSQHKTIHTLAPKSQVYPSLIPVPKPGDVVGVGQPIVVRFDHDIKDRSAAEKGLEVTATPGQQGSWSWMSGREVHYRPRDYWKPGTKVSVKINLYGVDLGGGAYGQTDRTLDFTVHDSWVAKADGNTEQMQIFHNDQFVRSMPISMGKDITPTHLGAHVISDKQQKYTMDSCTYGVCPGDPKYYRSDELFAERISNDGEFVHENPASVAQQGSANVSHGCINLDHANAQWFFENFGLGDVVEIANSGGQQLPAWDTYGDWSVPWEKWQSGSALR